jgi:hypothetical protein
VTAGPPQPEARLLYFRADGCAVCVARRPVAESIARGASLPLEVVDLETGAGRERAERLWIRTGPTLALVRGERVPFRLVGRMITEENATHLLDLAGFGPSGG